MIFLALLLALLGLTSAENAKSPAKILVGPNILVSRDGDVPHVELMIAANPRNPKNFLGGAITFASRDGGAACKAYASMDGGNTWWGSVFPEQVRFGGGDPQVAFGLHGTAYFVGLGTELDDEGQERSACHFYRSMDGGLTWAKPFNLGRGLDHEQVVVDHSFGRFAGRVYVGALWGYPEYQVGVFRSDDDGRTFTGPVKAATGRGEIGINVCNMLLMSDGTLFVPYADYPFLPEKARLNTSSTFWFVTSRDGGVTFSSPGKIAVQTHPDQERYQKLRKEGNFIASGFPMFAIDASSGSAKDRIYCLWTDDRMGKPRVFISRSSDVGATWSEPALVDPSVPDRASQFQPMISVNKDGAVAAMWYDTRSSRADDSFDLYLSASVNGGESFLPPVRVSTGSSFPRAGMNLTPASFWVENSAQSIKLTGISAFSRWPNGGDYIGLTAAADGTFHPFWADSRDGAYQIYTCPVVVRIDPATREAAPAHLEPVPPSPPRIKAGLNDKVELVFDPARYDSGNGTATLFIRIKNASKQRLFGPLVLKVKSLINEELRKYSGEGWENIVEILNAANGQKGPGAEFDYSPALRDFEALEPGALSEAVAWKIRFPNKVITDFYIEVEVTGVIEKK